MSKLKTLSIGLGAAAVFVTAILPMAAYADNEVQDSDSVLVKVNVATVISLTLDTKSAATAGGSTGTLVCDSTATIEDDPATEEDESSDGCTGVEQVAKTIMAQNSADLTSMYTDAYVSTNSGSGYTLSIIDSDDNTALTSANNDTIAAIASKPVAGTNAGWAVSVGDTDVWQQIPAGASESSAAADPLVVENYSPNPAATSSNRKTTVHYGVATAAAQAVGTYEDTIIYTATAK